MTGLLTAQYTCKPFRFSTPDIILWAGVIEHAYAAATAPCILATYFGLVMPYLYNFIA